MVLGKDAPGFEAVSKCGGVGASVSVSGEVVASKGKGQEVEIKAEEVEVSEPARSRVEVVLRRGIRLLWWYVGWYNNVTF